MGIMERKRIFDLLTEKGLPLNQKNIKKVANQTRRALFGLSGVSGIKDDWLNAIRDFQLQRQQLDVAESQLYDWYSTAEQDSDDLAEWNRLFSRVNASKSAMDGIANAVQTASEWFQTATGWIPGLSGARQQGLMGSLGIAIPAFSIGLTSLIAIIGGAAAIIASVSGFIVYLATKRDRMSAMESYIANRQEQLVDGGMEFDQASQQAYREAREIATEQAQEESGYSIAGRIERVLIWGGAIAAALYLIPKFAEKK